MSTHNFSHLIFNKDIRKIHYRKAHQQMMLGKLGAYVQKDKIRPISIIVHKS